MPLAEFDAIVFALLPLNEGGAWIVSNAPSINKRGGLS